MGRLLQDKKDHFQDRSQVMELYIWSTFIEGINFYVDLIYTEEIAQVMYSSVDFSISLCLCGHTTIRGKMTLDLRDTLYASLSAESLTPLRDNNYFGFYKHK